MRIGLIFSLLLAIFAAVFALQNPGYMDLELGPYAFRASTALILLTAFALGAVFGILTTLPSRIRSRRQVKALEKQIVEERRVVTQPEPTPPPHDHDPLP